MQATSKLQSRHRRAIVYARDGAEPFGTQPDENALFHHHAKSSSLQPLMRRHCAKLQPADGVGRQTQSGENGFFFMKGGVAVVNYHARRFQMALGAHSHYHCRGIARLSGLVRTHQSTRYKNVRAPSGRYALVLFIQKKINENACLCSPRISVRR